MHLCSLLWCIDCTSSFCCFKCITVLCGKKNAFRPSFVFLFPRPALPHCVRIGGTAFPGYPAALFKMTIWQYYLAVLFGSTIWLQTAVPWRLLWRSQSRLCQGRLLVWKGLSRHCGWGRRTLLCYWQAARTPETLPSRGPTAPKNYLCVELQTQVPRPSLTHQIMSFIAPPSCYSK